MATASRVTTGPMQPEVAVAEPLPSPPRRRAGWIADVAAGLALVGLLALALHLRLPLLELGYNGDEIANVTDAGFLAIFDHPETGVNPPAFRWLFNVPFEPWDTPWWGRRFSMACSLVAVVLGYVAGLRASGGNRLAGLAAAALLALHPAAVRHAGLHRIYAWWSATALTHLLAVERTLTTRGRGWLALAVLTGMLLPWIHYLSVPLLLGLGVAVVLGMPGRRRYVGIWVPAALGTVPLWPYVLFEEGRRVSPDREPLGVVFTKVGSFELEPPAVIFGPLGRVWRAFTGEWPYAGPSMLAATCAVLAVGLLGWRRLPVAGRLSLAGVLALFGGVLLFGQVQYVRPSTVVMTLTLAAPALFGVAALPRRPVVAHLAVAALAAWYAADLPRRYAFEASMWEVERMAPEVVARWRTWDDVRGDRPVVVHPSHGIWTLWFHLTRTVPRNAPRGDRCAGFEPCFEYEGVAFGGVDVVGDGSAIDGLLLHTDAWRPEGFAATCRPVHDTGTWAVFDCRRGATAP